MGNCATRSFHPLEEDPEQAWKRQTRGKSENNLYKFVDLKGKASTAELVKIYREGGREGLVTRLRADQILIPYLYNRGKGKLVSTEEFSHYEKENQKRKASNYRDHTLCFIQRTQTKKQ